MRNILIFIESRFPVDRKRIKGTVNRFLDEEKIKSKIEVGVSIVGDRKMRRLNKLYRSKDETTSVLTFSLEELNQSDKKSGHLGFVYPEDGILRLGDVIISYPQAVSRAAEDNMLVDDKMDELIIHGLNNLVGKEDK